MKRHSDGCVDIVPLPVNKRIGVLETCNLLGCEPRNLLTVVDGENDQELAEGTIPIAPSNANLTIKDAAHRNGGYVSSYENGVGFADGLLHLTRQSAFEEPVNKRIEHSINSLFPQVALRQNKYTDK